MLYRLFVKLHANTAARCTFALVAEFTTLALSEIVLANANSVFVLVIILIYYFVYDLITKKSIQNIRLSIIYFVSTIVILISLFSIVDRDGFAKEDTEPFHV